MIRLLTLTLLLCMGLGCRAREEVDVLQPTETEPAVVEQPAAPAAEPTVVNQWTDETGHTWRIMSDGSHRWWNGTDWQMV